MVPTLAALTYRVTRPEYPTPVPAGGPDSGLPAAPATRFAQRRNTASADERARLDKAVHVGDTASRYLRRAFAAGHPLETIEALSPVWAGRDPAALRADLGRFDPPVPGPVPHGVGVLRQVDQTTCGSAVVVVARSIVDPVFADSLAAGPVATFGAVQLTVHRAANVLWPRAAGTTPMGIAATLNVHSGAFGTRYGWFPVDARDQKATTRALAAAATSTARGWPVPLLIGRWEPRHYVLLVGGSADELLCYEPSGGRVVSIAAGQIAAGHADPLGWPTLHAVVLPVTPA